MSKQNSSTDLKRHPIQVVSRRSGLSIDVLRVWEKRYGLITPARSAGGHRLYSDEDVERLRLVCEAMAGGRRVGQLAQLSEEQLQALVDEDRREAVVQIATETKRLIRGAPEELVADSLEAISELNAGSLKAAIDRATFSLSPTEFIEQFATPLMHRVGELWHRRQLSPAHEHLASNVVRNALSEMIAALQPKNGVHRLVVATPVGQAHELAAVLVTASAQLEGWAVFCLGPDLPAVDIAKAVEQTGAEALALSITVSPAEPQLSDDLHALRKALPSDVTVVVGGQAASALQSDLNAIGARYMDELPQFRMMLRELAGSNDESGG